MNNLQANGIVNVHFRTIKIEGADPKMFMFQVVGRLEHRHYHLHTSSPSICIVNPKDNTTALMDVTITFHTTHICSSEYNLAYDAYNEEGVFNKKRHELLREMAHVIMQRWLKFTKIHMDDLSRKADMGIIEPLFEIPLNGLDEMIKNELTVIADE